MGYLQALVLAVVQGITEFVPVSSSGHLLLLHQVFGSAEASLSFDLALHWGTVMAVIIAFRQELWKLIQDWWRSLYSWDGSADQRLPWYMLLCSLPAAVVGGIWGDQIEQVFRSGDWVILMLVAVAFLFFAVEKASTQARQMQHMTWKDALMIGIAQVLSFIPGTSRSGITMVAGMARNLSREQSARFSFLASTPLVFVAASKELLDVAQAGTVRGQAALIVVVATLVSGLVGFLAIRFLLRFVSRYSLRTFAWYRIALALVVLLLIRFS